MNSGDLAEYFGMTRDDLYQLRYLGKAPPALKIGGRLRWRKRDVDTWLDLQAESTKGPAATTASDRVARGRRAPDGARTPTAAPTRSHLTVADVDAVEPGSAGQQVIA